MAQRLEELAPTELWLPAALKVLNESSSPADYCKRLTTDPVLGEGMLGNHLYLLDSSGTFRLIGGYGINPLSEDQDFNQFDDSIFAQAVSQNRFVREPLDSSYDLQVCPAVKAGTPIGAILTVLKPQLGGVKKFRVEGFQELSYYLSLGMFISGSPVTLIDTSKRQPSGEKLTERQTVILTGIAQGKTNLQISKELILSESAIKQETVKIFRALGVSNRREAAIKAASLGMVPSIPGSDFSSFG